jgi:hypothetical protein
MFLPNNIWDEVYGGRQVTCLKWMNKPYELRTLGPAVTFQSLFIFYTYTIHFCGTLVYAISTVSIITIYVNAKVKTPSSWFLHVCIAQKEHTLKMNLLPESQTKTKKLSDTF